MSEQPWVQFAMLPLLDGGPEIGGVAIALKAHRIIVPSPSTVQTKRGTTAPVSVEGLTDVGGKVVNQITRKVVKTASGSHTYMLARWTTRYR